MILLMTHLSLPGFLFYLLSKINTLTVKFKLNNMKKTFLITFLFYSVIALSQPTITSFSPMSGPIGTIDTILGTGFSTTLGNNVVYFGATRATVNSAISTRLIVIVPIGATYQNITVMVSGLIAYSLKPFIVTFGNGGSFSASSFDTKIDFTTGSDPWFVTLGDLDGDGKSDIVVANMTSNTLSIFRNTSSSGVISFATKIDVAGALKPNGIAISDIDGDGKPDLSVSAASSSKYFVYRNTSTNGNISFASPISILTGNSPVGIAAADFNADGKTDIVVPNSDSTISVYKNTSTIGNITFAAKIDFTTGYVPQFPSIGDFDGDGKPDIVVSNTGETTISVFRNTTSSGAISFASKINLSSLSTAWLTAIGDLDGDGKLDIVVADYGNTNVTVVFRNISTSGNILFAPKVNLSAATGPWGVAISDLDGDGKPDIAITDNKVSIYKNTCTNGTISFTPRVNYSTSTTFNGIAIGDLDGDGKPDIVATRGDTNSFSIFRNTFTTAIGINEINYSKNTSIYPNPSQGNITINFDMHLKGNVEIFVFDITGRLVKSFESSDNATKLSLENKGVYIVQLKINGTAVYKKIVVE